MSCGLVLACRCCLVFMSCLLGLFTCLILSNLVLYAKTTLNAYSRRRHSPKKKVCLLYSGNCLQKDRFVFSCLCCQFYYCLVLSSVVCFFYLFLPCLVISCNFLYFLVLSCISLACVVSFCLVLFYLILSLLVLSLLVLFYYPPPRHSSPTPTQSLPTLPSSNILDH
jgi:hypothetical protein